MPSWKKLVVSGSDARVATLFTSGHLTSSGNISSSFTGSFGALTVDGLIDATSSVAISSSHALNSLSASNAVSSSTLRLTPTGLVGAQFNVMLTPVLGSGIEDVEYVEGKVAGISSGEGGRLYFNPGNRTLFANHFAGTASLSSKIRTSVIGASYTGSGDVADKPFPITFLREEVSAISSSNDVAKGLYAGDENIGITWQFGTQIISGSSVSTSSFGTYLGDGSQLTGINPGVFRTTGSFESTTNDLQVTGSVNITGAITASNITSDSSSFSTRITPLETTSSIMAGAGLVQAVGTKSSPIFAGLRVDGDLLAERLIISSSVSHITSSFSSGSTIFGDTLDDTHLFTGSLNVTGSMKVNGLNVLTGSSQIASGISGSFTVTSQSIATSRNTYSQSISARLGSVEAGNVGDGSMSGDNTGDVTLNTGTADYLSISGQQITLGQVDLSTDVTGNLQKGSFGDTNVKAMLSGSLGTNAAVIRSLTRASITGSSTVLSQSLQSRVAAVEASAGGQDLSTTGTPIFGGLTLSGSLKISGSKQSTSIEAQNIQNGYPTSNNWQESLDGSYFNNFDNTTHVSEILRFMAGVISHSIDTASPTPNTKFLNTITTNYAGITTDNKNTLLNGVLGSSYQTAKLSAHWTSSAAIDMSTTGSYRAVQNYLISKGFMVAGDRGTFGNDTGTNPFSDGYGTHIPTNISRNNQFDSFALTVTSNAGGSTSVRSSADNQLFGLGGLSSGNANQYVVRVIASQSFSDNQADPTPDASSTFHKKEVVSYTQNSFGTSNGLTLAKINTASPAVIPAAFQDGKFSNVAGPITGRFYTGGSQDENDISASGYYKMHDVKVGIQSGSGNFNFKDGTDSDTLFYLYTGGLPADITTSVPSAVVSNPTLTRTGLSVVYKSLSGCPYIQSVQYNNTFSSEASNLFEPAYDSVTVLQHDISTNEWDSIDSSQTITPVAVATDTNGVDTSVANSRGVLSADKSTLMADGDIPHRTDIAFLSSSISMSIAIDSGISTTVQTKSAQAALTYTNTFRSRGRNWKNAVTPNTSTTLAFYNAALFTANSVTNLGSKVFTDASGSMAIHAFQQGYDGGSLSGTTEQFSGEDFRIQLNNNVVAFSGDAFVQTFNINRSPSVIGDYDLQVKPGFLVDPGSTNGYWFPNGHGSGTYKYYIRRFQTSGTKTSLTVNVGQTLQAWNSTSNGISVAILFKSSADTNYARARIYDPTATSDNDIETNISSDNHKNPFTDAIDLYGNTGGSVSSTTYTMPLRNIDGMTLDNTNNEYYLIIRYKGNPTPVTQITVGY